MLWCGCVSQCLLWLAVILERCEDISELAMFIVLAVALIGWLAMSLPCELASHVLAVCLIAWPITVCVLGGVLPVLAVGTVRLRVQFPFFGALWSAVIFTLLPTAGKVLPLMCAATRKHTINQSINQSNKQTPTLKFTKTLTQLRAISMFLFVKFDCSVDLIKD